MTIPNDGMLVPLQVLDDEVRPRAKYECCASVFRSHIRDLNEQACPAVDTRVDLPSLQNLARREVK